MRLSRLQLTVAGVVLGLCVAGSALAQGAEPEASNPLAKSAGRGRSASTGFSLPS